MAAVETDAQHPHDVVAAAMLGGGGRVRPQGEELEQVVRIFQAHHELLMVVVPLIVTYFLVMRCCFGSWTLRSASAAFQKGESFEQRYNMAFDRRHELTSQINSARIAGEEQRVSTLRGQLADLDEDIDLLGRVSGKKTGVAAGPRPRAAVDELRRRRAANLAEADREKGRGKHQRRTVAASDSKKKKKKRGGADVGLLVEW